MINRRNYYRILHVQPDSHREIIKASYRTLMQKLKQHPDLGGDNWNASILNEAYSILTNSKKRAAYDKTLKNKYQTTRSNKSNHEPGREKQKQQKTSNTHRYKHDNSRCPFCRTPVPVRFCYGQAGNCSYCDSTLTPVVKLKITGKSRRALQRTSHHAPIQYYCDANDTTANTGTTMDLSPYGMQLLTSRQLDDNQIISIVSPALSAVARVSYCRPDKGRRGYNVGVEFLTLIFHKRRGTFLSESA